MSTAKVAIARAVTRPSVGRLIAHLTDDSLRIRGARINTASPLIEDRTRAMLALRLYERAELGFVSKYLRSDLDVVELGASIGVVGSVVLGMLAPGRRLIAVEADPGLAAIARENFRGNAGSAEWTVMVAVIAYGTHDGLSFVRGASSTGGRLARTGRSDGEGIGRQTLSDVLATHRINRYALIADIEGAEAGILQVDHAALARCDQMIIELHDTDEAQAADMRAALIERHAFSVIAERGPVLVLERLRA